MNHNHVLVAIDGIDHEFEVIFSVKVADSNLEIFYMTPLLDPGTILAFKVLNDSFVILNDEEETLAQEIYLQYQKEFNE
ncbi:MAG: hypothetical protein LBR37_01975 [Erysipelotrichaceae bacterium]|jgi:hypothetical protein|nr:hypothetical protein [Erysipelotrichaceae bacterium]